MNFFEGCKEHSQLIGLLQIQVCQIECLAARKDRKVLDNQAVHARGIIPLMLSMVDSDGVLLKSSSRDILVLSMVE
jgi:hypothetical protein